MHHESKKPLIFKGFRSFFYDKKKTVGRYDCINLLFLIWWSIKDFAPMEQYTCTRCWKASFPTASFGMRTLSLAKPKSKARGR